MRALFVITYMLLLSCSAFAQEADTVATKGHRTFGIDCMQCHGTSSWHDLKKDIDFEHKLTGYVLAGNHASVSCSGCHDGTPFSEIKIDCASCHKDQHKGELGNRCGDCHTPAGWRSPNQAVARHQLTRFPLIGAHAVADCQSCHLNQTEHEYVNTSTECYSCHQQDYEEAKQPDHVAGGFDRNCAQCHDPGSGGWKGNFDHNTTSFPLRGAHAATPCVSCHVHGLTKLPTDCWSCHEADYGSVAVPNHAEAQFSHECERCHEVTAWRPATFDHDLTNFRLTGAHQRAVCQACHVNGQYSGLPLQCQGCHSQDYNQTSQPNHQLIGFTQQCEDCHNTEAWQPVERMPDNIDHDKTRFPLLGRHRTVACVDCHIGMRFAGTPLECYACHDLDYNQTKNPDHAGGQFDRDCLSCHTMDGWKPATFDHAKTQFPLEGAHMLEPCEACHINGDYQIQYVDCWQCHEDDFNKSLEPNHVVSQFEHDCTSCHNVIAWKPSTFDHAKTNFPLEGAHQAEPCESCHINGDYGFSYVDCWQCHETDYNQSQKPNHVAAQFEHDCTRCHNIVAWVPSTFDHATTQFPLEGAHQAEPCESCHINGDYNLTYIDCWQCHQTDFNQTQNPNHVAAQFAHNCLECHTTTAWQPSTFDHATTKFPLTGAHLAQACESCHINGDYNLTYTDCWQCHETDFNQTQNPNHVAAQFAHNCLECHTTTAWQPSTFDHATTQFPLTGAHLAQACESCHINGDYNLTYTDCWQCHETDFNQTQNPNHVSAQFAHDCLECHTTTAWQPSTFDHATTKFPLTGAHLAQACEACHINGDYNLTYTDCWQCHEADFNQTLQPNHAAAQFEHDCTKCHGTLGWKPSTFDHATTKFPLEGAHLAQPCESCHINGDYNLTYVDCWQCHETDFNQTQNPNHVSAQFAHDCLECHTTTGWQPSTFNHASTKFPLDGAHQAQPCEACHINGDYNLTYTDCWQCHETDFNQTQQPNHVSAQFVHDCLDCHTTAAWQPSTFDHASTKFLLDGAHQAQPCEACHINGDYNLAYTDCWQCHETDFNQTQQPNHATAQFSHDCTTCHNNNAWQPSTFDHAATHFALEGAHANEPCQSCHIAGNYNLTYTNCVQCHLTDYDGAKNPDHATAQFSTDCTTCHTLNSWKPSTFDHATTNFPLQGAHVSAPCQSCHIGGNYNLTYTDCWQCHETDYNSSQNPAHAAGQFSHDCLSCHTLDAWSPATFDHNNTAFPLQGAHATEPCQSCHINGNYNLTYTTCIQCHQSDFDATVNPNHSSNQFPQDCMTCHTQNAWTPSTFDHAATAFPLTGAHQTRPCLDCHTGGNYAITFTDCLQCHQSDYNSATNPSHASNQFSTDCTICHTTVSWTPSTFSHASTNFPLTGAHTSVACLNCHVGGNYQLTYTDCYQCHQSDYNGANSPANHQAMNLNHNCLTCHTQSAWDPASPFRTSHNVNAPAGFPIYGGAKHGFNDEWNTCNECHTTNNTTTFCCTTCHEHSNQSSVNGDHTGRPGYSYTCTSCANTGCHPDGRD